VSAGETYYRFESLNGCLTITLLPELNDKQWADIERVGTEIVDRISAAPSPKVLVDLTPLSYMGSAMVALIVRLYKTVNSRGGKMVVVNQHELVQEVLKLAGLTKLWTILPNRQEAFSSLGVRATAASISGSGGGGTPFQPNGMGLVAAGVIGTFGTLIFLALQFSSSPPVPQKIALMIEIAFAFVGLGAGMFLLNQTGNRRNLGIAFLAICVLAVLGGIVAAPQEASAKGAAAGSKTMTTPAESKTADAPAAAPPAAPVAAAPVTAPAASTASAADSSVDAAVKPRKSKVSK
jgi:anti-anti-sigma factor